MAAQVPALRIRALTLMDVLDESFRIYRANFPVLAGLAILLFIPLLAVQLLSGTTSVLSAYYAGLATGSVPLADLTAGNPFISLLQYPVQLANGRWRYPDVAYPPPVMVSFEAQSYAGGIRQRRGTQSRTVR